jgi:hypothetical protein
MLPSEVAALLAGHGHVYVVIVTQPLTYQHKDSFVMISSTPLRAIAQRNLSNSPYRDMRDKIPYLYPEFIAGPIRLFALAADFADQLVVGRRGLPSKVRQGCAIALSLHVPCYHIARPPPAGFDAFLRAVDAPPGYREAAARLATAVAALEAYAAEEEPPCATALEVAVLMQIFNGTHVPPPALAAAWPHGEPSPVHALHSVERFWRDARLGDEIVDGLRATPLAQLDARAPAVLLAGGAHADMEACARPSAGTPQWLRRAAAYLRDKPKRRVALSALSEEVQNACLLAKDF